MFRQERMEADFELSRSGDIDAMQAFADPDPVDAFEEKVDGRLSKRTFDHNYMAQSKKGYTIIMPDDFDLLKDFQNPKSYLGFCPRTGKDVRVKVDHEATGTGTTGTGNTIVTIL